MEAKKKRLTLDLDPTFQRRLKAIAALKGVSMRGYCQAAIDRELTRDEANGMAGLLSEEPDHELFCRTPAGDIRGQASPREFRRPDQGGPRDQGCRDRGVGGNGSVVVDASLAIKWLVEEDDSDKAHAALQSWVAQDITRIAPHLMPFEVANALHRRVLRGELNVGDSIRMIARLACVATRAPSAAGSPRQSAATCKPAQAECGLRRPLPGAAGEFRLRAVDRRREVLPGGKPKRRQRALVGRVP